MKILVINCGSSSVKYKFYQFPAQDLILKGSVDNIGEIGVRHQKAFRCLTHTQALELILKKIDGVDAVGHRVVHGGEEFKHPVVINGRVILRIKRSSSLAPIHNPANLAGVLACQKLLKKVPQVAVFDTAFHQSVPKEAFIYGLPYSFYRKYKIRKYGFHGTSHEYVAGQAAKRLKKSINKVNLITCHLGNGCSITAIARGKSVDTSMGFTPLEGLVMGTRSGDIDPALITYLIRQKKISAERVDQILNQESGLRGISGVSNDMRRLISSAAGGNKRASLAIDIFIYRIRKYISAYLGVLGRVDAVIFTAGISENQPRIIERACRGLFDNLKIKPKVMVIPTNEELMIARQAFGIVSRGKNV